MTLHFIAQRTIMTKVKSIKNLYAMGVQILFALCAFACVFAVAIICIFLFTSSIPSIMKIGFVDFIFGSCS